MIGTIILVVSSLIAIFAGVLAPHSPTEPDRAGVRTAVQQVAGSVWTTAASTC